MGVKTASKGHAFIILPKEYTDCLQKLYELDHGVFIKDLNPSLNEKSLQEYFETWGTVTACEITMNPDPEVQNAWAFVRFSSEDEADGANEAGPHSIGGISVEVTRVVRQKMEDSVDEAPAVAS